MTVKIFYEDRIIYNFESMIEKTFCSNGRVGVITRETIFYPEGGGQPCDKGSLDGIEVVDVQETDEGVIHYLGKKNIKIPESGKKVLLSIDRDFREDNSIQHTAQHLLSAILDSNFNIATISFHLGTEYSTIDIETAGLPADFFEGVEVEVNKAIMENRQITVTFAKTISELEGIKLRKKPSVDNDIRIVQIDGYDASPCCGTHAESTGILGVFKILKTEKYKGYTRIYFISGKRSVSDYLTKHEICQNLANSMSCNVLDLEKKVSSLCSQIKFQNQETNRIKRMFAQRVAKDLETMSFRHDERRIVAHYLNDQQIDSDLMNLIAEELMDSGMVSVVLLMNNLDLKLLIVSNYDGVNCGGILREILPKYQGKGGGNNYRAQAVFDDETAMENCFNTISNLIKDLV
ncbi:MAG: alanine--tRNA ligase-related protein [Candidatus Cloacimonetes bacterium]|nr:alanine--tRNA ligase-related protein [Candidatus Cloacimonadota bacterium]